MMNKLRFFSNAKLIFFIIIAYTTYLLITLIRITYYKINGIKPLANLSWPQIILEKIIVNWILMVIIIIIVTFFTKYLIERRTSITRTIIYHLLFFVGCTILMMVIYILELAIIGTVDLFHLDFNDIVRLYVTVLEEDFNRYAVFTSIVYIYYYFKINTQIEFERMLLKNELMSTKMKVLRSQLQPHFIFNTLNSISSLMEINVEKSQNLIADFGDLLRSILDLKNENRIPLQQELKLLDKYLAIVSVRFSDHLEVHKNIDPQIGDTLVPNMIIQPIVENAIKHGYSYDKTQLTIYISIRREKESLHITIENNGALLNAPWKELLKKGTGLSNTRDRLQALYGTNYLFEMKNTINNSGVVVNLVIPI